MRSLLRRPHLLLPSASAHPSPSFVYVLPFSCTRLFSLIHCLQQMLMARRVTAPTWPSSSGQFGTDSASALSLNLPIHLHQSRLPSLGFNCPPKDQLSLLLNFGQYLISWSTTYTTLFTPSPPRPYCNHPHASISQDTDTSRQTKQKNAQ